MLGNTGGFTAHGLHRGLLRRSEAEAGLPRRSEAEAGLPRRSEAEAGGSRAHRATADLMPAGATRVTLVDLKHIVCQGIESKGKYRNIPAGLPRRSEAEAGGSRAHRATADLMPAGATR